MPFKIKTKVASVKNASKLGIVTDLGEENAQGVQWIRVKSGKSNRWSLEDAWREYIVSPSIPVPDGVVVVKRPNHAPEVFQQSWSKATQAECEEFLSAIQRMFLSFSSR